MFRVPEKGKDIGFYGGIAGLVVIVVGAAAFIIYLNSRVNDLEAQVKRFTEGDVFKGQIATVNNAIKKTGDDQVERVQKLAYGITVKTIHICFGVDNTCDFKTDKVGVSSPILIPGIPESAQITGVWVAPADDIGQLSSFRFLRATVIPNNNTAINLSAKVDSEARFTVGSMEVNIYTFYGPKERPQKPKS